MEACDWHEDRRRERRSRRRERRRGRRSRRTMTRIKGQMREEQKVMVTMRTL